jgi:hypothetical protein
VPGIPERALGPGPGWQQPGRRPAPTLEASKAECDYRPPVACSVQC